MTCSHQELMRESVRFGSISPGLPSSGLPVAIRPGADGLSIVVTLRDLGSRRSFGLDAHPLDYLTPLLYLGTLVRGELLRRALQGLDPNPEFPLI